MPRATAPPADLLGGAAAPTATVVHVVPPRQQPGGPGDVGAFLAAHALELYEEAFVAAGYHRLVLLQGMDEGEENELIAEHKMPRPHARALRVALRQLRHVVAPEQQAGNISSSGLGLQMDAPLLVAAVEEPILVHAVAAHEPHRRGGRPSEHRHDRSGGGGSRSHGTTSVGSSELCRHGTTSALCACGCMERCSCRRSRCTAGRFCQALLLLLAVATGLAFVYMDVCGDSWSDTGEAPSWCWPHQPSAPVCDGLDSPTGSKQWTRKQQASGRCGSYCCGAAYGSQCGHFTLHAPMAAMRFDFRPGGTLDANVTFSGGGRVNCSDRLKGQSWKYDTHRDQVDVESTCLATFWRAEKLEPPTLTFSTSSNWLSVDFSGHGGAAGWPSGHGILLRACPHPAAPWAPPPPPPPRLPSR
jgi:hypothetical protein